MQSCRPSAIFLAILPSVTLAVGVSVTAQHAGGAEQPGTALRVALGAAAVAPLIAMIVLSFVTPGFDLVLVAVSAMLAAIGTSALFRFTVSQGSDASFYESVATRHGLFVAAGCFAMIVGAIASRRIDGISRYPYTLLALAFLLTAVTVFLGDSVNGARLWLQLGPFRFQPSEVARLLLAAFVAIFLHERRHLIAAPWRLGTLDLPPAPYLLPLVGAVLAAAGVLALQNDLGMAALVVLGAYATVAALVNSRLTVIVATFLVAAGAVGAYLAVPRIRDRVLGWLDPWLDPGGGGYQFVQADYRLAAGGLAGVRAGMAADRVPEVHTDFLLVGIGSEFGILIAMAVLVLMSVLVCRCVLGSMHASNSFRTLLGMSFAALLGIQVLLIAGGTLRVLPLTGLTFPLVSYGGTSMIVTCFALGIILGIGATPQPLRESGCEPGIERCE